MSEQQRGEECGEEDLGVVEEREDWCGQEADTVEVQVVLYCINQRWRPVPAPLGRNFGYFVLRRLCCTA